MVRKKYLISCIFDERTRDEIKDGLLYLSKNADHTKNVQCLGVHTIKDYQCDRWLGMAIVDSVKNGVNCLIVDSKIADFCKGVLSALKGKKPVKIIAVFLGGDISIFSGEVSSSSEIVYGDDKAIFVNSEGFIRACRFAISRKDDPMDGIYGRPSPEFLPLEEVLSWVNDSK